MYAKCQNAHLTRIVGNVKYFKYEPSTTYPLYETM